MISIYSNHPATALDLIRNSDVPTAIVTSHVEHLERPRYPSQGRAPRPEADCLFIGVSCPQDGPFLLRTPNYLQGKREACTAEATRHRNGWEPGQVERPRPGGDVTIAHPRGRRR